MIKGRSKFEQKILDSLEQQEVTFSYEGMRIPYTRLSTYKPDIILPSGIIIEIKGYFSACDRGKHLRIKQQHENLDIRFVFMDKNKKLSKASTTTYAEWCEKHGFKYADKEIPKEWLT